MTTMEPSRTPFIPAMETVNQDGGKLINGNGTQTITLRMIMQGKEVGSIIGRKGDNVKKFREDSGAKINISDNSCLERIVTVMGTTETVTKAFTMIAAKLEEDIQAIPNSAVPKPPVTMRLVVPASQCGSLIGKGGSKINEIREETGASIQVASEMLPNSTERAVTISGSSDAIGQSVGHISTVFVESPPKGATIPYRPKPPMLPVIYTATGAPVAAAAAGAFCHLPGNPAAAHFGTLSSHQSEILKLQQMAMSHHQNSHQFQFLPPTAVAAAAATGQQIMAGTAGMNFTLGNAGPAGVNSNPNAQSQTHEMVVPNDLIGCIIGRGGCKINEIRQLSRATIKIANCEEGSSDRKVTIQGTPDTVNAAQYLINASMELHKSLSLNPVSPATFSQTPPTSSSMAAAAALPLSNLMKPFTPQLLGLNMGLFDGNMNAAAFAASQAAHKSALISKLRTAAGGILVQSNGAKKVENPTTRAKFSPY